MTLKERHKLIDKMIADGFCTHFPGYLCDRFLDDESGFACRKCINSWFISEGISSVDELRNRGFKY